MLRNEAVRRKKATLEKLGLVLELLEEIKDNP